MHQKCLHGFQELILDCFMISEQKFIISVTKYVLLAIDHTIKNLDRFIDGNVRSGRVSPLQVRFFGDPVDMLYFDPSWSTSMQQPMYQVLVQASFHWVTQICPHSSSFSPAGSAWSPLLKPFGYKVQHQVLRHKSNQVW